MTAVKASEVDRALAGRGRDCNVLLFYGPDGGRVAERAKAAAHAAVDDPADAFQLIRIDGDTLSDDPGRLVDEATTFGMFGGRRAIWVRPTGRQIAGTVEACLEVSLSDTTVVIEAGDLGKSAPLRTVCEASRRALALPCYADAAKDIAGLVADVLRSHDLRIEPDARDLLIDSLGGDRLASRSEVEKLALYATGEGTVTVNHVSEVVSDVSAVSSDAAIDTAFAGDMAALDERLMQLAQQGSAAPGLLALALRHALLLLGARERLDGGQDPESALRALRGLHFSRHALVKRQLQLWTTDDLRSVLRALDEAALEVRRNTALGTATAGQVLSAIARRARAPRRG